MNEWINRPSIKHGSSAFDETHSLTNFLTPPLRPRLTLTFNLYQRPVPFASLLPLFHSLPLLIILIHRTQRNHPIPSIIKSDHPPVRVWTCTWLELKLIWKRKQEINIPFIRDCLLAELNLKFSLSSLTRLPFWTCSKLETEPSITSCILTPFKTKPLSPTWYLVLH